MGEEQRWSVYAEDLTQVVDESASPVALVKTQRAGLPPPPPPPPAPEILQEPWWGLRICICYKFPGAATNTTPGHASCRCGQNNHLSCLPMGVPEEGSFSYPGFENRVVGVFEMVAE